MRGISRMLVDNVMNNSSRTMFEAGAPSISKLLIYFFCPSSFWPPSETAPSRLLVFEIWPAATGLWRGLVWPCWDIVFNGPDVEWLFRFAMLRLLSEDWLWVGLWKFCSLTTHEYIRIFFIEYCSSTAANYSIRYSSREFREVNTFGSQSGATLIPVAILHLELHALPSGHLRVVKAGSQVNQEVTSNGCHLGLRFGLRMF